MNCIAVQYLVENFDGSNLYFGQGFTSYNLMLEAGFIDVQTAFF